MKYRLSAVFALVAIAISCTDKELTPVQPEQGGLEINISGSIRQIKTKATAEGFQDKDAIGLYAVNYSDDNTVPGILSVDGNQATNAKYVFDESKQTWQTVKPVYYKDANTNVDIYCYYPYQRSIDSIDEYLFEVKQDQRVSGSPDEMSGYESSDFLWGKSECVAPTASKVPIVLNHIMAGVCVELVEGTGFAAGEFNLLDKVVMATGTSRKASINMSDGKAEVIGNAQSTGIIMASQKDGSYRAIVVPQEVAAGERLFAITIGSVTYGFKMDEPVSHQSGKLSGFTIRINKKSPSGDYEFVLADAKISDWVEDRNTHGGEARQYYVVNVPAPGKLGETIMEDGRDPNKIMNLKVVGEVNNDDFYFMRDCMDMLTALNMKEAVLKCDGYQFDWVKKGAVIPANALEGKESLYMFEFPMDVEYIDYNAFFGTRMSGKLVIPEGVIGIGYGAFYGCIRLTGLDLPISLESISDEAFYQCSSMSGNLVLPTSVKRIGFDAFASCPFEGALNLPDDLESIGERAFYACRFSGDLRMPDKLTYISDNCFYSCGFNGHLDLNNVTAFGEGAFSNCNFRDELKIPEGTTTISNLAFAYNAFSSIVFPSTLISIDDAAFAGNMNLCEPLVFPEGLLSIGTSAFKGCSLLPSLVLPSTAIYIGDIAFSGCYGINSIICKATQVPAVFDRTFEGVPKDNFTLEVPVNMVTRYQMEEVWGDFRRIAGHYDFSISRRLMRGLNAKVSNTYVLRVPSGFDWSIESKPDWVSVEPSSGTGSTQVKVSFSDMPRTGNQMHDLDDVNKVIGTGRNGEIVFLLDGKDYRTTMTVEQYDSDYKDGDVVSIQQATKGKGIEIIYIGDGYDARDIANGKFMENINRGNVAFFGIEPYSTYKDYFAVKAVVSLSKDSGIGTVDSVIDTKFGSSMSSNRILYPDVDKCFSWAAKAKNDEDFSKSLVIMLMNTPVSDGVTLTYADGSAIAICPVSEDAYPMDFRGVIQHEAGGHGFGKLGDEYIYHAAFIMNCNCTDNCDHPKGEEDFNSNFGRMKSLGWFRNLSMNPDMNSVPWSHLIFHEKYSDYVDMFEGGYMHSRGIYRSEAVSCMNNNIPYFSAISRQAIVERIMDYAGEEFTFEKFIQNDSKALGPKAIMSSVRSANTTSYDCRHHEMPVLMGEKPVLK